MPGTPTGRFAVRYSLIAAALALSATSLVAAHRAAMVSGRITVQDKGDKQARDVGQAVVWLERQGATAAPPRTVTVFTEEKEFRPRVTVIPVGSTVSFPNNDPFNHNVFSLSQEATFDLGLYGRARADSQKFERPGIIRVYCNVHPQMAAFIVVRDNPHFTQPSGDGTWSIPDVPAGAYVLRAWHERAPEVSRPIQVGAAGVRDETLALDARGFKFVQHMNKFGKPYTRAGARY